MHYLLTVSTPPFCWGDNVWSQVLKNRGQGVRKKHVPEEWTSRVHATDINQGGLLVKKNYVK